MSQTNLSFDQKHNLLTSAIKLSINLLQDKCSKNNQITVYKQLETVKIYLNQSDQKFQTIDISYNPELELLKFKEAILYLILAEKKINSIEPLLTKSNIDEEFFDDYSSIKLGIKNLLELFSKYQNLIDFPISF